MPQRDSPWFQLAVICLYSFSATLAAQSLPPISSLIIEDLGLSHAQMGLFISIFSVPAILLAIPLSLLSLRLGPKKLGMASISLMITGSVIILLVRDFPLLLMGRLVLGIGTAAMQIISLQGVASWFRHHRMGVAMSIYSTSTLLAFFVALVSFGAAGVAWGWRSSILISLVALFLSMIFFARGFRLPAGSNIPGGDVVRLELRSIFRMGAWIWVMGVVWACCSGAINAAVAFLPDYIYSSGQTLAVAGMITSIILAIHVILGPFIGLLLDKVRYKHVMLIAGIAGTAIAAFFLASYIQYVIVWAIFIGIFATIFMPAMSSIVPSLVPYAMLGLAYGITTMVGSIGSFAGPYLAGMVRDITGGYQYSYWFVTLVFAVGLVLITILFIRQLKLDRAQRGK